MSANTEERAKAAAFDKIAKAYKVGASRANIDRIVLLACVAAEVRDEAHRTCDEAVEDSIQARAAVAAAIDLLEPFEGQPPPYASGLRLDELREVLAKLRAATEVGRGASSSGAQP